MRFFQTFFTTLTLLLAAFTASAQTVNPEIRDAILEFADDICGVYQLSGEGSELSLEGKAEASVDGLIGKLATLGVDGTASVEREKYTNVGRDEIAGELKDVRTCRIEIWKDLKDTLVVIDRERSSIQTAPQSPLPVASFDPNSGTATDQKQTTNFREFRILAQPSFDCRRAATTHEFILCTDPAAASSDVAMSAAYTTARSRLGSAGRNQLRATQRRWLEFRSGQCLGDRSFSTLSDVDLRRAADCLSALTVERRNQLISLY